MISAFPPQNIVCLYGRNDDSGFGKTLRKLYFGRKLTIEQIDTISRLAHKHDFRLAGFRNFERAVTDEEIAHIQDYVEEELAMRNI